MIRISIAATLSFACADTTDDMATTTGSPPIPEVVDLSVDTTSPAFVDLILGEVVDLTPEAAATDAFGWHLALQGSEVFSNGGISGTGLCSMGVAVEAGSDDVARLSEAIPAPPTWVADSRFDAMGVAWHNYNASTGVFTAVPDVGYLVRGGEGTSYARLRVVDMEFPSRDDKGVQSFTIDLDLQAAGADTFDGKAPSFEGAIGGEGGDLCYDVDVSATVDCSGTAWDVLIGFEGRDFYMRTNSGPAGDGNGGAIGPISWGTLSTYTSATSDPDSTDIAGDYRQEALTTLVIDQPWYDGDAFTPNYRIYALDTDASDDGAPKAAFQVLGFDGTTLDLRFRELLGTEG